MPIKLLEFLEQSQKPFQPQKHLWKLPKILLQFFKSNKTKLWLKYTKNLESIEGIIGSTQRLLLFKLDMKTQTD